MDLETRTICPALFYYSLPRHTCFSTSTDYQAHLDALKVLEWKIVETVQGIRGDPKNMHTVVYLGWR